MKENLRKIYEYHHSYNREEGFSILKEERGELLRDIIGKGKEVLDIGCRDGALTKFFVEGNEVLGVDVDGCALEKAEEKLGIEVLSMDLNGDWEEIGGMVFDVVVAGEVLEHIYYPEVVTQKIKKHLKEDGVFIGSVPNAFSLKNRIRYLFGTKRHTPLSDPTHITHFQIKELEDILEKNFSKVEILGLGRYRRLAKMMPGWFAFDLFFICRK